ncbi:MAG: phosphotransferase, partial [Bacteroidaceae bacterium]|nr:phosphotransferase [Bacteroidaceae bacterium]
FHCFIDTVPSTPTCLHGDLHIGNIITDGSRDLWIDVGDFAYGVPEWDLSMMYYGAHSLSPERADNIFHLDNDTLRAHWDAFAKVYYGTDSKEAQDAEVRKLQPFIATKIALIISKLSDGKHAFSGPLLQLFDKYLPQ